MKIVLDSGGNEPGSDSFSGDLGRRETSHGPVRESNAFQKLGEAGSELVINQ